MIVEMSDHQGEFAVIGYAEQSLELMTAALLILIGENECHNPWE